MTKSLNDMRRRSRLMARILAVSSQSVCASSGCTASPFRLDRGDDRSTAPSCGNGALSEPVPVPAPAPAAADNDAAAALPTVDGLDGEPVTVSSNWSGGRESLDPDSLELVDDWVPNIQPPDSLRECFFEKLVRRLRVDWWADDCPLVWWCWAELPKDMDTDVLDGDVPAGNPLASDAESGMLADDMRECGPPEGLWCCWFAAEADESAASVGMWTLRGWDGDDCCVDASDPMDSVGLLELTWS